MGEGEEEPSLPLFWEGEGKRGRGSGWGKGKEGRKEGIMPISLYQCAVRTYVVGGGEGGVGGGGGGLP